MPSSNQWSCSVDNVTTACCWQRGQEARRSDLRWPLPKDFVQRLEGKTVEGLGRRAKYLLADLSSGDVLLMHPLMLHAPTPNVLATPRMMLAQFVYGRS